MLMSDMSDYGDAEEVVDESSLWISEMLHLEDALDVVDLVTPCTSTACWTYDESTHTCTMTGQACVSLSCGATGFMITFPSTLYNLVDDQVPATFAGGLSPQWDGSKWVLNLALGQNGMIYNIDATTDA